MYFDARNSKTQTYPRVEDTDVCLPTVKIQKRKKKPKTSARVTRKERKKNKSGEPNAATDRIENIIIPDGVFPVNFKTFVVCSWPRFVKPRFRGKRKEKRLPP